MRNLWRALFVALVISLLIMRPASSYADWTGHDGDGHGHDEGHSHDGGHGHDGGRGHDEGRGHERGHDHSNIGVYLNVWPDYSSYGAPYYPPADAVLVSSPMDQPVVLSPQVITSSETPDVITVNIPNNEGGYTAVTLRKSGTGFIGPQGEFYPEFPKVSQLEVIYGKQN